MTARCYEMHAMRILELSRSDKLNTERDAIDLIGEALGQCASVVVIDAGQLNDEFFALGTRLAGGIVQKFVNYSLRLVIVGDISARTANSTSLRDFVTECNRGRQIWFVSSIGELEHRLQVEGK